MAVSLLSSLMSPGLGVGCVLLLITNVTSLTCPSFQFQAHATPLPSWLTTPNLLAAVILRSPGFSPLLFNAVFFDMTTIILKISTSTLMILLLPWSYSPFHDLSV